MLNNPAAIQLVVMVLPYCESKVNRFVFFAFFCESNCELVDSAIEFFVVLNATLAPRDEFVELLPLAKLKP
jgi:hypothetical protein